MSLLPARYPSRVLLIAALAVAALAAVYPLAGLAAPLDRSLLTPAERAWLISHPVIRQGIDATADFPPIEILSPQGVYTGMSADYLRLVAERLGVRIELQRFPDWPDTLAALGDDRTDIVTSIVPTAQRAQRMLLSQSYLSGHHYIVVAKDTQGIARQADLRGKRVAIERGFSRRELLNATVPGIVFVEVPNTSAALRAVFAGKADAYVGNGLVVSYLLEHLDLPTLVLQGEVDVPPNNLVFGINPRAPELARLVDRALESITNEERAEIRRRWVPERRLSVRELLLLYWPYLIAILAVFAICAAWLISLRREVRLRIRAEEAARTALEAAENATRFKSDFLASMSHEIRTPMNGILGMAHLALEAGMPATARGHVLTIQRAANSLLGIINDILDFSRLEAGKLPVEAAPFDLDTVLDDVMALLAPIALNKAIGLRLEADPAVPRRLIGDPLRLGQVLVNLCSNAVKFTAVGEVVLYVDPGRPPGEAQALLHFRVTDTGIGISDEARQRLFQRFEQAEASTSRQFGGSGLGLTISHKLVQAMGGELTVESALGHGSTFQFSLTLGVAPPAAAPPLETDASALENGTSEQGLVGRAVLLVDDNEINQELAYELLSAAGMLVTVAGDGAAALDQLERRPFDIVLMDCQMPVMDGYAATRAIRARPQWRGLPVIAMTADAMSGDRDRALEVGMNDHIAKPIDIPEMYRTLIRWLPRGP